MLIDWKNQYYQEATTSELLSNMSFPHGFGGNPLCAYWIPAYNRGDDRHLCNTGVYTGVTSDLVKRVWEHKEGVVEGFTKRYDVKRLVYYEVHENPEAAITREKRIKKWKRAWKIRLIEEDNPDWSDLYKELH